MILLYCYNDLRKKKEVSDELVQCPVEGCTTYVKRQTKQRRGRKDDFLCIEHGIYISPTTFQYEKLNDNLITPNLCDYQLLSNIFKVKTENRLRAEKSEDTVVWNVFRTLEKQNEILSVLPNLPGTNESLDPIYWGFYKNSLWDNQS